MAVNALLKVITKASLKNENFKLNIFVDISKDQLLKPQSILVKLVVACESYKATVSNAHGEEYLHSRVKPDINIQKS